MSNLDEGFKYKDYSDVKERIDKNHQFIKELEKLIVYQENDLDKLRLIEWIGFLYMAYVTGQYASKELEQEIIEIGNRTIQFSQERQPQKNHILIVMTESGAVGGHSVLVNNWIRWDTKNQYSVAFTGQTYDKVVDFIKESTEISGGKIFCLNGDYISKAKKLLDISQDFERIFLFNHMHDVIPDLAYGNQNWTIPVLFYNHADFRFSFGLLIADKVLNLCSFDQEKTEQLRGVPKEKNVVVRFPNGGQIVKCEEKEEKTRNKSGNKEQKCLLAKKYGFHEDEKLIVSAGADFKYQDILDYSFTQFVETLLNRYDGKASFLIIGADKEKEKWKKLYESTNGKGRAMGILRREEMEKLIEVADLYIVSFPMAGTGGMVAEKAEIPYLALFITERGMDSYAENAARNVNELIEKSLDVLNGDEKRYLGHMRESYETQEEWQHKWEKLLACTKRHSIMEISPKRDIEIREYVNCQLMQDSAAELAAEYLYNQKMNRQLQEQIIYLDDKYEMNIYNRIRLLEKISQNVSYSNKHLKLYLTTIKWVQLKQQGKSIEDYLLNRGFHTVAIYGMSYMGDAIYRELQGSSVTVLYGIDQKAEEICAELAVYYPDDAEEKIDCIINSTMLENQTVSKGMKKLQNILVVSIKEILDAMDQE